MAWTAPSPPAFRSLVNDHFPDWMLTPVNATDYRLNMKPSSLVELKRHTVDAGIARPIDRRVNALGVTEPTVQDHGAARHRIGNPGRVAGCGRSRPREGHHRRDGAA